MKRWRVTVEGFDTYEIEAESRSKARYIAYKQFVDVWSRIPFLEFMRMCSVYKVRIINAGYMTAWLMHAHRNKSAE